MIDIWDDEGFLNFFLLFFCRSLPFLVFRESGCNFEIICLMWIAFKTFAGQPDTKRKKVGIMTLEFN